MNTAQSHSMVDIAKLRQLYQDDGTAQSYDRERFGSWSGQLFNRFERRAILRALRVALSGRLEAYVLDMACGTGRITEALLEQGMNVVGADISLKMLGVARKRCKRFGRRAIFELQDLLNPTLPEQSFDVVTCVKVLHHFATSDRAAVLRSLARMTRRHVIVSISHSSPIYRMRRHVKRLFKLRHPRNSSTRADMQQEAAAAGLRVVTTFSTFPLLSEDKIVLLERI